MNRRKGEVDEHAETAVFDDVSLNKQKKPFDVDATVVLGDDYRHEVEEGSPKLVDDGRHNRRGA